MMKTPQTSLELFKQPARNSDGPTNFDALGAVLVNPEIDVILLWSSLDSPSLGVPLLLGSRRLSMRTNHLKTHIQQLGVSQEFKTLPSAFLQPASWIGLISSGSLGS